MAGDISLRETGRDFVSKTVEKFGRLDVFVSNAGVCQFADFLEYVDSWLTLSMNSVGVVGNVQEFLDSSADRI